MPTSRKRRRLLRQRRHRKQKSPWRPLSATEVAALRRAPGDLMRRLFSAGDELQRIFGAAEVPVEGQRRTMTFPVVLERIIRDSAERWSTPSQPDDYVIFANE